MSDNLPSTNDPTEERKVEAKTMKEERAERRRHRKEEERRVEEKRHRIMQKSVETTPTIVNKQLNGKDEKLSVLYYQDIEIKEAKKDEDRKKRETNDCSCCSLHDDLFGAICCYICCFPCFAICENDD